MFSRALAWSALASLLLAPAACSSGADTSTTTTTGTGGATSSTPTTSTLPGGAGGGGGAVEDAGPPPEVDDGPAQHGACTGSFGTALATVHGRLDGILVSIVPMGKKSCNGDSDHVHLQVRMNGAVYDVAVNTDVLHAEVDAPMPHGAWVEGWHPATTLDYPTHLGVHAGAFTPASANAIVQLVESAVANANHISVFATGYGPDGIHNVHRRGSGHDGALVIRPLSPNAHILLFRFTDQSF